MPSNIYANKIRGIIYNDGTTVYTVTKYKNTDQMFEDLEIDKNSTSGEMKYMLFNSSALDGVKLMLVPTPTITKVGALKIFYIRNANRMVDNNSVCDIPEFTDYVIQFMKVRCYEKEGHPNLGSAIGMLEYKKKNMVNTLMNMVPDGATELDGDPSFYWDMDAGIDINVF